jgi:acyl carrier protein
VDKQDIASKINAIFAEDFEIDPERLTPETEIFTELGLDSLDMVELMVALQKAFSIQIQDGEEVRAIRTMDDLYGFVIQCIAKPSECESGI